MASLLKFVINPVELQDMIKIKHDLAESSRRLHFIAARKIQAWIRGIITRNHLRRLHENAIIIQRHWRGYRARMFTNQYLIQHVQQMWQDYYTSMATRIQAVWRGYWIRKTQINFVQLRRWLKNIYMKNDETLKNMKKYVYVYPLFILVNALFFYRFRLRELEYAEHMTEQEAIFAILYILFKLHHLLGTKCCPGVITRIDKTRFTYIEEMLKCLEYDQYVPKAKAICKNCQIDRKPSLIFRGTYFERCKKEIRELEKSLQTGNVSIFRSIAN
ncbi:spermatogenesis-associated protein 17-like isoform X1 [Cataglyphis hispanica]|uniref:spermatogenesis-associated protein 17-like isoform X1 n=1 Tax=Cataglyphis hispanica TaxID=1086592 RepID=UPI00217FC263|nr:spermatogenesis-associated protein 17-like isoform X1 [Cataglyphis hispanica]